MVYFLQPRTIDEPRINCAEMAEVHVSKTELYNLLTIKYARFTSQITYCIEAVAACILQLN